MSLINIYDNWQKAKDYDRLVKENELLSSQISCIKYDINTMNWYIRDLEMGKPILCENLKKSVDLIESMRDKLIDYMACIQKRDPHTGKFIKK